MFPANTRILIADHTKQNQRLLSAMLERMGYENITIIADGELAKTQIQARIKRGMPFELMFAGALLPRMAGLTLYRHLRENNLLSELSFILVAHSADRVEVLKALGTGVSLYLVEPISLDSLRQKIEEAWAQRRVPKVRMASPFGKVP